MKRQSQKSTTSIAATNERRKFVRATLVGSALISPKSGAKAITAVLDNVNRVGAGLHTKEKLPMAQPVTVSLAFLDSDRAEQLEARRESCLGEAVGEGVSDRRGLGRAGDEREEPLVVLLPRRNGQVLRLADG